MWKDISQNNRYEVSDTGIIRRKDNKNVLSGCIASGYRSVKLTFDNGKQQRFYVHRLVAQHFIPNDDPKHKTFVNHKDGNKLNNKVDNLEWVSPRENNLHYYQQVQKQKKERKAITPIPVIQYTLDGQQIASYPSISKASKSSGISIVQIARNIHNEITHTGSYIWIRQ